MTETIIYCDHCKRTLCKMSDYVGVKIEAAHKWQNVDLCVDCFELLCSMIDDFCIVSYANKVVTDNNVGGKKEGGAE